MYIAGWIYILSFGICPNFPMQKQKMAHSTWSSSFRLWILSFNHLSCTSYTRIRDFGLSICALVCDIPALEMDVSNHFILNEKNRLWQILFFSEMVLLILAKNIPI
jgi:hypothetical protein